MDKFSDFFTLTISKDKMIADLCLKQENGGEIELKAVKIKQELEQLDIKHGVKMEALEDMAGGISKVNFPITVAVGTEPVNGSNGYVKMEKKFNSKFKQNEKNDFRDIMKIPTVKNGEKIAEVFSPTEGTSGMNVAGQEVSSQSGKPALIKAGKNVVWKQEENAFYASIDGQLHVSSDRIHVFPLYEVQGDLSLKTGDIDFIGTIVVRGNVPTGYKIKAGET